jgi:hypothetical protein
LNAIALPIAVATAFVLAHLKPEPTVMFKRRGELAHRQNGGN